MKIFNYARLALFATVCFTSIASNSLSADDSLVRERYNCLSPLELRHKNIIIFGCGHGNHNDQASPGNQGNHNHKGVTCIDISPKSGADYVIDVTKELVPSNLWATADIVYFEYLTPPVIYHQQTISNALKCLKNNGILMFDAYFRGPASRQEATANGFLELFNQLVEEEITFLNTNIKHQGQFNLNPQEKNLYCSWGLNPFNGRKNAIIFQVPLRNLPFAAGAHDGIELLAFPEIERGHREQKVGNEEVAFASMKVSPAAEDDAKCENDSPLPPPLQNEEVAPPDYLRWHNPSETKLFHAPQFRSADYLNISKTSTMVFEDFYNGFFIKLQRLALAHSGIPMNSKKPLFANGNFMSQVKLYFDSIQRYADAVGKYEDRGSNLELNELKSLRKETYETVVLTYNNVIKEFKDLKPLLIRCYIIDPIDGTTSMESEDGEAIMRGYRYSFATPISY